MKIRIVLLCLLGCLFGFSSCKKEEADTPLKNLNGIWVEQQARLDTIQFLDGEFLALRRGREFHNGHLLPKYGAGWYDYEFQGDSISLLSMLSSNTRRHTYFFHAGTETLTIGNFFTNQAVAPNLIFVRLR